MKRALPRIVLPYVVFASLWILLSDTVMAWFAPRPELFAEISIAKGLLFVTVTAGLLSVLLRWELRARDQIQKSLQASEHRYRNLFERTNHGVVYLDPDRNFTAANPAALRLLGPELQQHKETDPYWRAYRADGSVLPYEEFPSSIAFQTGQPALGVVMGLATEGKPGIRWLLVDAIPEYSGQSPRPDHVFVSFSDITAVREAEERLRQSEARSRLALEAAKAGTWEWNLETNQLSWSEEVWALYGLTPQAGGPSYELWRQTIHASERFATEAAALRAIRGRKAIDLEWRVRGFEPGERWLLCRGQPVKSPDGEVRRYLGVVMDITDRKEAEQRVHRSESRFRRLLDMAPIPLCQVNLEGALVYFNERMIRLVGYHPQEVPTIRQWWELAYPDPAYRAEVMARWETAVRLAAAEGTDIKPQEYALTAKDGAVRIVEISGIPMDDGLLATFIDVTDRRRADDQVRKSEETLRIALDAAQLGAWHHDLRTDQVTLDDRAAIHYGFTGRGTFALEQVLANLHPEDRGRLREAIAQTLDPAGPGRFSIEYRVVHPRSGDVHWLAVEAKIEFEGQGLARRPIHGFGATQLITQRKTWEVALKHSLEEKVALLKEVHHRVKNNLQIVASLLNLQARNLADARAVDLLKETRDRVFSMALLHEVLYRSSNLASIDLGAYLRELCEHLARSFEGGSKRVEVLFLLPRLALTLDHSVPCGLIVNELVSNAFKHAFPKGRKGQVRVEVRLGAEGQVCLEVADDGVGLPAEGLNLAQSPTLGLQLVSDLSRQLGGAFTVRPNQPAGSVFQVRFPLAPSNCAPGSATGENGV